MPDLAAAKTDVPADMRTLAEFMVRKGYPWWSPEERKPGDWGPDLDRLTGDWGPELVGELRDEFCPSPLMMGFGTGGADPVDERWMAELDAAVAETVVAFARGKGWRPLGEAEGRVARIAMGGDGR